MRDVTRRTTLDRMALRKLLAGVAAACLLASCGGDTTTGSPSTTAREETKSFDGPYKGDVYPVFASSEIVVGTNRLLVGLLDDQDAPIGSPRIDVHARFFDLTGGAETPVGEQDLRFIPTIPGRLGLYMGQVEFDRPGKWGAELEVVGEGLDEVVRASFRVTRSATTPEVGKRVPASDTPTAASRQATARISTDPRPDPRFYSTSIAGALKSRKPFVAVFATPKFCTSQVCGPTLDVVKRVSKAWPDITFIHVEVYTNLDDPSNLETVPAVEQWGLPSEPWVFVVDDRGRLAAKYEGVVAPFELTRDLRRL